VAVEFSCFVYFGGNLSFGNVLRNIEVFGVGIIWFFTCFLGVGIGL